MQLNFFGPAAIAGPTPSQKAIYSSSFDVSRYDVIGFQAQAYAIDSGTTLTVQPQHTEDPTQDDLWEDIGTSTSFQLNGTTFFASEVVVRSNPPTGTNAVMSHVRVKVTQSGGSGTYLIAGQASVS